MNCSLGEKLLIEGLTAGKLRREEDGESLAREDIMLTQKLEHQKTHVLFCRYKRNQPSNSIVRCRDSTPSSQPEFLLHSEAIEKKCTSLLWLLSHPARSPNLGSLLLSPCHALIQPYIKPSLHSLVLPRICCHFFHSMEIVNSSIRHYKSIRHDPS